MATARVRKQILATFRTRLETISQANGFLTDAGQFVALGEVLLAGPDDPDYAIAIVPGTDEVTAEHANIDIELPVEIQVVAKASSDHPFETLEDILTDLKVAVELADDRLFGDLLSDPLKRGSTRVLEFREPGTNTVGVGVLYLAAYVEGWGDT